MAFGQYSGGIGTIVGGVIGAVVGYYTPLGPYQGAMLGASIGGGIGGIAGQVFWPERTDIYHPPPPQPNENRVQISTYGAPVPIVYESSRLAGNIIYMQDPVETIQRSRHRQDGVRYYEMVKTYTSTFAIAFCEGEVEGIARIWVNGKVFADYRDPAGPYYPTGSVGLATANLQTTIARAAVWYSIYLGSETQTADASLAAILTAAETPSYRGICYIVFQNFPVGEYNGVPTIEVEIGPQIEGYTGLCSEYYNGNYGDPLPEDVFTYNIISGSAAELQELSYSDMCSLFVGSCNQTLSAKFEFLGEFDINVYVEVNGFAGGGDTGYVLMEAKSSSGSPTSWVKFSTGLVEGLYDSSVGGSISTGDVYAKIRITRDSSSNIYVYYWNFSLSRWEWNGDVNGKLTENFTGPVRPKITVDLPSESFEFGIHEIATVSGCDNAQAA